MNPQHRCTDCYHQFNFDITDDETIHRTEMNGTVITNKRNRRLKRKVICPNMDYSLSLKALI